MEKIKRYITTGALSFMLIVLLESVTAVLGWGEALEAQEILEVFIVTALIAVAMYFLESLTNENLLIMMLVHLLTIELIMIVFVVFIFGMLEADVKNILGLLVTGIVVYIPVLGFTLIKDKNDADKINMKIMQRSKDNAKKDH